MVVLGLLALFALIAGAVLTSRTEKTGEAGIINYGAGIRTLIISTLGYAGYTIVVKAAALGATAVVLPQAVGMVIGALLFSIGHHAFAKATAKKMSSPGCFGESGMFSC